MPKIRKINRFATAVFGLATALSAPHALGDEQPSSYEIQLEKSTTSPFYEKVYSKDELSRKIPANPVIEFHQTLSAEIGSLLSGLTSKQAQQVHVDTFKAFGSQSVTTSDYSWYIATMKEAPKLGNVNADGYRQFLRGQMEETMSDRVKNKLTVFTAVTSGVGFSLNLGKWYDRLTGDAPPEAPTEAIPAAGLAAARGVRYGLILKEIEPDFEAPKRAALSDLPQEELRYAGKAKVVWSIGPLDPGDHSAPLFAVPDPREVLQQAPREEQTLWSTVRSSRWVPSMNFGGRVAPETFGSIARVGNDPLPNIKLTLAQEANFYSLTEIRTTKNERVSTVHAFRMPLVGAASLGRQFNHRWELIQTDWNHILVHEKAPMVNLHYIHVEERFLAGAGYTFQGGHVVGVDYRERSLRPTDPNKGGEAYGMSYLRSF